MRVTTPPSSAQPSYACDNNLDLVFPLSGFVIGTTIRVHGNIDFGANTPGRGQLPATGRYLSPLVGAHGFFSTSTVRVDQGQVEFISAYPAYVAQYYGAMQSTRETCSNADAMMELRSGLEPAFASAATADAQASQGTAFNARSFSIVPLCCLTGTALINAQDHAVALQLRLAPTRDFIVNNGGNTLAAVLSDVYISYETTSPKLAAKLTDMFGHIPMSVVSTQQVAIRSGLEFASINIPLPGQVIGWSGSFMSNNVGNGDRYALTPLPGLSRVRFTLDGRDAEQLFPYQLAPGTNDPLLLIQKAHEAIEATGRATKRESVGVVTARDRDQYGLTGLVGQRFSPGLEFRGSSTLGVEITSGVNPAVTTYVMFMSFYSRVENLMK